MSEHLAVLAETEKLARLLDVPVTELDFLAALPSAVIQDIRDSATDVIYETGAEKLRRVAAASKLVPNAFAAVAAEKIFGPLLAARLAVLLEPGRAADLTGRMPTSFIARVCTYLDPRRAEKIIERIPDSITVSVARELIALREHVTMGRFVGYLTDTAIARCIELAGERDLLRIAFFVEAKHRLDTIVDAISDDKIGAIVGAAAENELWRETLALLDSLSADRKVRCAHIAVDSDDETVESMVRAVHAGDLFDVLLPLVTTMTEDRRRRMAALPVLHEPAVLAATVRAAITRDLWPDLLPLVDLLPDAALAGTVEAMLAEDLVESALAALDRSSDADLAIMMARVGALDPALRKRFADRAEELGVSDRLGALGAALRD